MGTAGINALSNNSISPKGGISSGQSAWDNQETSIRNEIKRLQEEVKALSKDDKLSEEQKSRQKQALQEEIQSLNSELKQYQIQKRQEEVQKKQENAKPGNAKSDTRNTDKEDADEGRQIFGSEQLGVIITISLSNDQVSSLEKVRKDLEGKQRTASTEEEKEKLQQKIDNVSKDIGQKIVITEDSLKNGEAAGKFGTGIIGIDNKEDSEKDDSPWATGKKLFENQNEIFENVSVIQ